MYTVKNVGVEDWEGIPVRSVGEPIQTKTLPFSGSDRDDRWTNRQIVR